MIFFVPDRQVQSDRQVMRETDRELSRRSIQGAGIYLLLYVVVVSLSDFFVRQPQLTYVIGVILLFLAVARIVFIYRFEAIYALSASRWRNRFFLQTWMNSAVWSAFLVLTLIEYQSMGQVFTAWIFTAALAAGTTVLYAPYFSAVRLYLLIMFAPSCMVALLIGNQELVTSGILFIVYLAFLMVQGRDLNRVFWDRVESNWDLTRKAIELETAMHEAARAGKVKNEFLANMNQEIRTPMTSILGMLSLLQDTPLDGEQREFVQVATHSGEALLALINDVLDFSRIAAGKIIIDSVVFNLRRSIEDCMEVLGPIAHEKKLELSCAFDPGIPLRVRGDPARITQLITNLVNNAIKFTEQGEVVVRVHLEMQERTEALLRVEVVDEGCGISEEARERLFRPFSPLDVPGQTGGAGLGLAICKGLVTALGGEIGCESEPGQGSAFWFTARLVVSSQQADRFVFNRALRGKRILLVNMAPAEGEALVEQLEDWNIEVAQIQGFDPALQVLRGSAREGVAYDTVITNVSICERMNECFNFVQIVNDDAKLGGCRQLVLSTLVQRGSSEAHRLLEKTSGTAFVTKPVRRLVLHDTLCRLFGVELEDRPAEGKWPDNQPPPETRRILLVEDNKVNQMVAKGMLQKLGYGVRVANHGMEALGLMQEHQFDLVLMDCTMPEMDGYEATRQIRDREKGADRHVPIVAMTAAAMEGDEARCLAVGMDDYLAKPVDIKQLDGKLRRWIGAG